jgi:hypothetical protein
MANGSGISRRLQRIGFSVLIAVAAYGMYHAFKVVSERNSLIERGRRTCATITETEKEKCGYGYGYSANYTYVVDSRTFEGHCECESRAWVHSGDMHTVAYDPIEPEKSQLIITDP